MISDENPLDNVLDKLADGDPIDWDAAAGRVSTPAGADLLRQLRILEALRDTHRSTTLVGSDSAEPSPRVPPGSTVAHDTPDGRGRRWGRYRLVRHIGEGSYGAVYLAHDDELDRDLAIKLLHPKLAARADLMKRVKAEGRALARVHHTHVVAVYDVEEHEQQLGLCMEYVHGRTLADIVRSDGPMNAGEALVVGQAVCRGLAAVHAARVVHRDVKARNVVRERAGRIVLMDLGAGLDRARPDDSSSGNVGTPVYMAPELFEGESATRQSDIYSFGVLMYFLVTGEYPVTGGSVEDIKRAHRAGRCTKLHERRLDLPEGFLRVVERATAADPKLRYESAGALLRDLTSGATEVRSWVPAVQKAVAVLLAVPTLAALSGVVATQAFNRVLDRPVALDSDSVADIVRVGFQSLLLPAAVMAVLLAAGAVLRQVVGILPGARRWWHRMWHDRVARFGIREQDHAALLAAGVVVAGFASLLVVWIVFNDVMWAYLSTISESDLGRFSVLSPENEQTVSLYRLILPALLFVLIVGWAGAHRVRQVSGGVIPGSLRAAAAVLVGVLLLFLQAPYKLRGPGNEMPVALVEGNRCYVLAERDTGARVYCPAWPVPRVRFVESAAPMQRCGFEESVFHQTRATGCARDPAP